MNSMSWGVILLQIVVISVSSVCAGAQTQENFKEPTLCLGDEWTMRGYSFTIPVTINTRVSGKSAAGYEIDVRRQDETQDQPVLRHNKYDLELNRILQDGLTITPSNEQLAYPLRVGKRWDINNQMQANRKSSNPAPQIRTGQAEVLSNEHLRTDGGSFDSFKIRQIGTIIQGNVRVSYHWQYWYAPIAKAIIKSDWRAEINGRTAEALRTELSAMKLGECEKR